MSLFYSQEQFSEPGLSIGLSCFCARYRIVLQYEEQKLHLKSMAVLLEIRPQAVMYLTYVLGSCPTAPSNECSSDVFPLRYEMLQ